MVESLAGQQVLITAGITETITGCDYIIHLSSLIRIPYSYEGAHSDVRIKITGILNSLQEIRSSGSLTRLGPVDENLTHQPKSEADCLLADNSKIQKLTDWKSQVSFQTGLAATADSIGQNLQYFNVERYFIRWACDMNIKLSIF